MRVVIAGGGTAGHVFPAIALAERLREEHGASLSFIGASGGQESRLVPAAGFEFHGVAAEQMPRELSARTLRAPFTALASVRACRPIVSSSDVVVGMGGYASVPALLAARWTRRPIVLHEQNAVPGLANRLAARWARVVALTFADAGSRLPRAARTIVTGNPVRRQILEVLTQRDRLGKEACEELDLEPGRATIAVFGGSQGALALDRAVTGAIPLLAARDDLQLLVLTGTSHFEEFASAASGVAPLRVRAIPFLERIELALAVAELAVSRAGASHVAELTVCGVPSVLVPYPHATANHQEANARELERAGCARMILGAELTPEKLAGEVSALLSEPQRLARMRSAALVWARPEAASRLASLVVEAA